MGRPASHAAERVTFGSLFRQREFAALWLAGAQSTLGDQLGRVALAVLVYQLTGSGLATASTYALTLLPAVIGGITLSWMADRYPRRALVVGCDLVRAALFATMAIPGVPLPAVLVLLVVAVLCGSPYNAAEPAIVADLYTGDRYSAALAVRTATSQAAQLAGFAIGGVVVALTGARHALAVDAVTFLVSAALLRWGLADRPPASGTRQPGLAQIRAGVRVVAHDRRLRVLVAIAWLAAFWMVPDGLAAPYANAHHAGAAAVGVLLAANPCGNLVGVLVLTRWVPSRRRPALIGVLAVLTGAPLVLTGFSPPVAVAAGLWALTGLLGAHLILIVTEFVSNVPPNVRGQAIGLASSGLLASQGIGMIFGGALATVCGAGPAIMIAGATGSALALPLAVTRRSVLATSTPG